MYTASKQILHIPPIPATIGLTDRNTGKAWYLKVDPGHTDPNGHLRLVLTDTLNRADASRAHVFDAHEGPWLGRDVRLFVRGARLGYEVVPGYNITSPPVIARGVNNNFLWYLLALPTSETFTGQWPNDHLAYSPQTS